jgi:hypothetical protein
MSYPKIPEIPRAERTYWSAERGGRVWQYVGGKKVKKFTYSPFTAKPKTTYTFYADITMEKEIESPPNSGKKRKSFTIPILTGTYLEFRDEVLSSNAMTRMEEVVVSAGGGSIVSVGYWRNKAKE